MIPQLNNQSTAQERRAFWLHHVDQHMQSGLNQTEYCKHHNLKLSNFWNWKKKLRPDSIGQVQPVKTSPPDFISIPSVHSTQTNIIRENVHHSSPSIQCTLPNGVVFSWPASTQPDYVAQLIKAVNP